MRINNNLMAMNTHRQLGLNSTNGAKSIEKLSSGLRINRAGDDAAGLAISEKMRAQVRGLNQASRNAQDSISLIQTAEGALNETHAILQRMRELAVQSATDTNIGVDRSEIQKEVDQLAKEITRISNTTEFNKQTLLNGGITGANLGELNFHIGANEGQNIALGINAMDAKSLGVARDVVIGGTATVAGTAAGIGSVTIQDGKDNIGSGIVDGANLTFKFIAGENKAQATGSAAVGTETLSISGGLDNGKFANDITIKFAAGTNADTKGITAAFDQASNTITLTVVQKNSAGNTDHTYSASDILNAIKTADLAAIGVDESKFQVTLANDVKGTDLGTNSVKLSGGETTADKLAIISDKGKQDSYEIDRTKTSYQVKDGDFKGLTIGTAATKILADIDSTKDTATLSATKNEARAAEYEYGKMTQATTEAGIDVSTQKDASAAITTIQSAIETVSSERSKLGSIQNRLEHTIKNLDTSSENLQASESRIRDVDMAKEMMEFTKNNILQQAAQAMLAQANQQPQGVLQLLR